MAGPIEFLSDGPKDEKGPTQYGGMDGLVSDHPDHVLSSSEKLGIMLRAEPVYVEDPLTGLLVADPSLPAVDPVTGRVVEDEWNESGSSGVPVQVPPLTESP